MLVAMEQNTSLCSIIPTPRSRMKPEVPVHVILLTVLQGDCLGQEAEEGSTKIFRWQDLQATSVDVPQETRKLAISCLSQFQF